MRRGGSHYNHSARWAVAFGLFGAPRAGASIAFPLATLAITGDPADGALVLAAMTTTQLLGAVPVARLGRHADTISFFKSLILIRTVAMLGCAAACGTGAPLPILVGAAATAGLVQGAAFGHLRNAANYLVEPSKMMKALGFGAMATDVTFVVTPILAATIGSISPSFAVVAIAALGAVPAFILPRIPHLPVARSSEHAGKMTKPGVLLWLGCAYSGAAAISAIEVGAVSIALHFGFQPERGAMFIGILCTASLLGSIFMSVRNQKFSNQQVVAMLLLMIAGTALIAFQHSAAASLIGCVLAGVVAAPLGAHFSLEINTLVSPKMRPEVFSLLKTSTSIGTILASMAIGWTSVPFTLSFAVGFLILALSAVLLWHWTTNRTIRLNWLSLPKTWHP
ncbi:MFS transporter [Rhizobium bangladeshense]|uniref:MFS transporter n=1 Tax=Rhizobium bangladeshense TaxID=1138189 RepID=UPI0007E53DB4|nr:MFS transporter [Rhizobium bangladeshense]